MGCGIFFVLYHQLYYEFQLKRCPNFSKFLLVTISHWPSGVECLPMVWETWVRSQVTSYQRLLKWYLIPPSFTLSNIRYVSRVKWSKPGKGVVPLPLHLSVVAIEKGAFGSLSTTVANNHIPNPKNPQLRKV